MATKKKFKSALARIDKWTYLLLFLLVVFGLFYLFGRVYSIWLSTYTDLWANLFASLIVILGIERISRKIRLRKDKVSITYVKGRIAHTLTNLMQSVVVPRDWQTRLQAGDYDWVDFFERIGRSTDNALDELDRAIESYSFILEADLRNDVFTIISILRGFRLYPELYTIVPNRDIWDLINSANLSATLISQSKQIMQQYNLLNSVGTRISFREGEIPVVRLGESGIYEPTQYAYYDEWIREAIAFRDECHRIAVPQENGD